MSPRRGLRHVAVLALAALLAFGTVAARGASGSDPLPTFEVTLTPNYLSPSDSPSSNYRAVWLHPASPTTPYRSPDSYRQQSRYLLLDPRYRDVDGRQGNDDWWFVIERSWPASYDPSSHGKWGREVNFHNVAGDAGPNGGVGWGFGDGVSALALDWLPGRSAPSISVQPDSSARDMALPVPSRDGWHTYVVHWVAGRTDGTTPRPGAITVWVDGNDTPHLNRTGINTVQRAQGPDGVYYVQRWMQLWEGDYTSALPAPATTRLVLTRIGRTLQEALDDRPSVAGNNLAGQYYSGSGANYGPPLIRQLTSRTPAESRIPASLGGAGNGCSTPIFASSIADGATVTRGTTWSVGVAPAPERVELWADGVRPADLTTAPYTTPLGLTAGVHRLGIAVTIGGARTVFGSGGVVEPHS